MMAITRRNLLGHVGGADAGESRACLKCPCQGHSSSRCGDLDAGKSGIQTTSARVSLQLIPFSFRSASSAVSLVTREDLEAAISGLIDILDVVDRDADLEPDGCDEPSLGWTSSMATGNWFDLEENEAAASSP